MTTRDDLLWAGRLLTPAEVALIFGIDPRTVSRHAKAANLPCEWTPGGHRRYKPADVRALLTDGVPARVTPEPGRTVHAALRHGAGATGRGANIALLDGMPSADGTAVTLGCAATGTPLVLHVADGVWLDTLITVLHGIRGAVNGRPA